MKRAALYARVSTDNQKDEQTIDTQLHEICEVITADGCTLVDGCTYKDEGWSGAFLERPALDELRQDAKLGKFDIVYVFDRGRLARKFVYQEIVIEELEADGVSFKSLHDVNGTTPEEMLMGSVMGVFHEYERVKIAERFRLGKLNKVRTGNLLGYNPPYGYDYVHVQGKGLNKKNGYFVINEAEARVIRLIFGWVGNEGISLREVVRRLYDQGIPPRKGRRASWTKGPVVRLLRNESYVGRHYYNKNEAVIPKHPSAHSERKYKHRHTNKTSRKTRDKNDWLMVKSPIIVDELLFDKVQKQLELNSKFSPRSKKHPYLFGSLIWCICGARRVGDGSTDKKYYRCTDRQHNFPLPKVCRERGINVTVLDSAGWEKLAEMLSDPKLIEQQITRYAKDKLNTSKNDLEVSKTKAELASLDEEERRYVKMYGMGLMSEDIYQEQMRSVLSRRKSFSEVQPTEGPIGSNRPQNMDIQSTSKAFSKFINDLSYEDKLFTVRKIVDKVVATKEEVTIYGLIPTMETVPAGAGSELINSQENQSNAVHINNGEKVGLRAINRYRRPPKCRQIHPL